MSTQTDSEKLYRITYLPIVSENFPENWETSSDISDSLVQRPSGANQEFQRNSLDNDLDDPLDCKYGGTPFMSEGEKWPICSCNNPMEFAIQINLWQFHNITPTKQMWGSRLWGSDVHDINHGVRIYGDGLLQLWVCQYGCHDGYRTRIVRDFTKPVVVKIPQLPEDNMFPLRRINDWIIQKDSTNFIESDPETDVNSNDNSSDNSNDNSSDNSGDNPSEFFDERDPFYGDKIGGDPFSIGSEQQSCPQCKGKMRMILQLSRQSNNHNYCFGGHGYAYIYQCPSHIDQVIYCY